MRHSLMIKEFFLTAILFLAVAGVITYPHSAAAVNLKTDSIVGTNTIMLSDVFAGLPEGKERALGPAPRPGEQMTLNARTLMRVAIALDLPWRPATSGEYITLTRAATVIDAEMIKDALQDEMTQNGVSGNYKLAFAGALSEMILPLDMPSNVEVQMLNVDHEKNRFNAVMVAPSKAEPLQTIRVSGAIQRMIDVPVLSTTIRTGTVIGARDIEMISIREDDVRHDIALKASDVIGLTPRRAVMAGKLLKMNELQAPLIVERGDIVTMIFDHGGMSLTAKGKALENGAKGDLVRVANTSTSRTVQAMVSAEREVRIEQY